MKYSNEQIRGAILRAADRIERDPSIYNFNQMFSPNGGCGTTACAWGWIGFELGMFNELVERVAKACRAIPPAENRGATAHLYEFAKNILTAKGAPSDMRAYADKFYPAVAEDRQLVRWDQCAWQPKAVA